MKTPQNATRRGVYETWEDEIRYEGPAPADYLAYLDDEDRIMALLCHNTDLSDGWEEEGRGEWFSPLLRGTFLPHGDQHCLLRPDALITPHPSSGKKRTFHSLAWHSRRATERPAQPAVYPYNRD